MTNTEFVDRCKRIGLYESSLATWLEKIESLQAKVKELESVISALSTDRDGCYEIISAKQSKMRVLTDAATIAADQIRVCDYTPARSTLLVALADVRGK